MYIVKTWTSHNNITEHTVTVIHVCMYVCVCVDTMIHLIRHVDH